MVEQLRGAFMKTNNIVLWGSREDYDRYKPYIDRAFLNSADKIIAFVCNNIECGASVLRSVDYIQVLPIDGLQILQFDYLINLLDSEVQPYANQLLTAFSIPFEKVIPIHVFTHPYFNWDLYVKVKTNCPSVISHHCFAGYTYHSLGLRFKTPLINMFVPQLDMIEKLYLNLQYYIDQELKYDRMEYEPNLKRDYPVFELADIELHFNHYHDVAEAIQIWNRRKGRINFDNLIFELVIENDAGYQLFHKLPKGRRIGFSSQQYSDSDIVYLPMWKEFSCLGTAANVVAAHTFPDINCIDPLKLLLLDPDFIRTIYG